MTSAIMPECHKPIVAQHPCHSAICLIYGTGTDTGCFHCGTVGEKTFPRRTRRAFGWGLAVGALFWLVSAALGKPTGTEQGASHKREFRPLAGQQRANDLPCRVAGYPHRTDSGNVSK